MNIFIDTSVIYRDPFWKTNFAIPIIEAARDNRVKIYISDVVIQELRRNFILQIEKELSNIRNSELSLRKIVKRHKMLEVCSVDHYLNDFDIYIVELFKNESIIKLESSSDYFHEILDRAIHYRKPFSDKRSEFKDAVIWMTYYRYAKENTLKDCYLLTNNVKDFAEPDDKNELHDELKRDFDGFKIHLTLKEFYQSHGDFIDKPLIEFEKWINEQNIDEDYVFDLIWHSQLDTVIEEVVRRFEKIDSNTLAGKDELHLKGVFYSLGDIDLDYCEEIEVDIRRNSAIVSGILVVDVGVEFFDFNPEYDSYGPKSTLLDSKSHTVKLVFSFSFDKAKTAQSFEIEDFTLMS